MTATYEGFCKHGNHEDDCSECQRDHDAEVARKARLDELRANVPHYDGCASLFGTGITVYPECTCWVGKRIAELDTAAPQPMEHFEYPCPECDGWGIGTGPDDKCVDCKGDGVLTGVRAPQPMDDKS